MDDRLARDAWEIGTETRPILPTAASFGPPESKSIARVLLLMLRGPTDQSSDEPGTTVPDRYESSVLVAWRVSFEADAGTLPASTCRMALVPKRRSPEQ